MTEPNLARNEGGRRVPRAALVDSDKLIAAMLAAEFTAAGGRTGSYVRLRWPGEDDDRGRSIVVPVNRDYADYGDLMTGVLESLGDAKYLGDRAGKVLDALGGIPDDEDQPDPLSAALHGFYVVRCWRRATASMSEPVRAAAADAVLAYDAWLRRHGVDGKPIDREVLVWWEE